MEDFGAQFYFSIAATSFLEFYFSIATTSSRADFLEHYFSIKKPIERGMLLSKWATNWGNAFK